jgi:RNA polymerase sigma factor for flagellar operon FliA
LTKYGPYVRSLASTVRRQFNAQLELDELMAYGQVGLLEAADRFDPKMGANFLTFAHYRIKGAIFDGLRKMGILKGADLRTAYAGERGSAYLGNLSDREQGGGNRGGTADDDVRELSSAVTGLAVVFATSLEASEGFQLADDALPADERLELEELKKRVRAAIDTLPEKEKKLLDGYYFHSKTLEEAGAEIGQSKSWASRLHARAVERLKDILSEEGDSATSLERRRKPHGGASRSLGSPDRPAARAGQSGEPGRQAGAVQVRPGHGQGEPGTGNAGSSGGTGTPGGQRGPTR